MRALAGIALLATVLLGGPADARRVVRIPSLSELCPANAEWSNVATCIRRHVKFTVVRDDEQLKIVDVNSDVGGYYGGVYIYRHDKQWALLGQVQLYQQHEVLAVQHTTFGNHGAERVDVGLAGPMPFAPDGENVVTQGVFRQQFTMVCFDGVRGCTQVMTSCDLLLHGKAYNTFRGTLTYENGGLTVAGDRTEVGDFCQQPGTTFSTGFDDF